MNKFDAVHTAIGRIQDRMNEVSTNVRMSESESEYWQGYLDAYEDLLFWIDAPDGLDISDLVED